MGAQKNTPRDNNDYILVEAKLKNKIKKRRGAIDLAGIYFNESYDEFKLKYILDNFKRYKNLDYSGDNGDDYEEQKNLLRRYYGSCGHIEYRQNKKCGRHFTVRATGMQGMKGIFRNIIAGEFYDDMDIVNCHPVLLLHLSNKWGFKMPQLGKYVNNRDNIIKSEKVSKLGFLKVVNGKRNFDTSSRFVKKLMTEVANLHNYYSKKFPDKVDDAHEDGKDNPVASAISREICKLENRILMFIWDKIGRPRDCVLIFDGIMIKKGHNLTNEKLDDICESVLKKYGVQIKLKFKKMEVEPCYQIDEYELDDVNIDEFENMGDYKKLFDRIVDIHLVEKYVRSTMCLWNNESYICAKIKVGDGVVWRPYQKGTLLGLFCADIKFVNEKGEETKKPLGVYIDKFIFKQNRIRSYSEIDFIPYFGPKRLIPDVINTFEGFRDIESKGTGFESTMIYNHIKKYLCANDNVVFNYLIGWVAHIIQKPKDLHSVCPLFVSKQGVGKDMFYTFLSHIIGRKYCLKYDNADLLFERFNDCQRDKLLIAVNELSSRGHAYKNHDKLKGMITREFILVDTKGIKKYSVKHYSRYIFFSNNEDSVRIEENNRRFIPIICDSSICGDTKYFDEVYNTFGDELYQLAFDYFANYDLSNFNVRVKPKTKIEEEVVKIQESSSVRYIKETVEDGGWKSNICIDVYKSYCSWCNEGNERVLSKRLFYKEMRKMGYKLKRQMVGNQYLRCWVNLPIIEVKQVVKDIMNIS